LCGVKDFSQVAKAAFFVKHLVSFAKLVAIIASGAVGLKNFAQPLYLVEKAFASPLAVFGIQVIFFIRSLFQMI